MTRLIVAGAAGRMGRMILAAASANSDVQVVGAFDRTGVAAIGQDSGLQAGVGKNGVRVTDDLAALLPGAHCLVEFTSPEASAAHVVLAAGAGVAMVIGTTGLDAAQRKTVEEAARSVPVVFSPNMSVGVNVLFGLVRMAAQALGEAYDVEIIEAHHRLKKDSPSGTAARMLEILATAREADPLGVAVFGRRGMVGPRPSSEIGVHAVRGGDIVGDHTVLFAGEGERVEITHRAHSREAFARGALRAAVWATGRAPGLYDMSHVLNLGTHT